MIVQGQIYLQVVKIFSIVIFKISKNLGIYRFNLYVTVLSLLEMH